MLFYKIKMFELIILNLSIIAINISKNIFYFNDLH